MASLPFDVLMEILPLLHAKDLPALARANKDLSYYALNRIYASIPAKSFVPAAGSILANPALALRVKSIKITQAVHGSGLSKTLVDLVNDVLATTPNLRHLTLDAEGPYSHLLSGTACRLHTFSCCFYTSADLVDFVQRQSELEELSLTHSLVPIPHEPFFFPKLCRLVAPMSWVDEILPNSVVSHLEITSIRRHTSLVFQKLPAAALRYLKLPFFAVKNMHPTVLRDMMPTVESLALVNVGLGTWTTMEPWLVASLPVLSHICAVSIFDLPDLTRDDDLEESLLRFVRTATANAPRRAGVFRLICLVLHSCASPARRMDVESS
ncbi:F-box domain-containing protein [Mycena kentingensis (nom. inval.)]|nr:F-box domain-containing protein [Mycena kentingensis (nom. inval.)]